LELFEVYELLGFYLNDAFSLVGGGSDKLLNELQYKICDIKAQKAHRAPSKAQRSCKKMFNGDPFHPSEIIVSCFSHKMLQKYFFG
jgi:hypothetical protein